MHEDIRRSRFNALANLTKDISEEQESEEGRIQILEEKIFQDREEGWQSSSRNPRRNYQRKSNELEV